MISCQDEEMNPLDIDIINTYSPYTIWPKGEEYRFITDNGIEYSVSFDDEDNFEYQSYWFNLTNLSHQKSPGALKIAQTVICIIEEFFRKNPDILLYLCSTDRGQQAQRSRLFLRWFKGYEQQKKYTIKSAEVKGDGLSEFFSLIVMNSHPKIAEISEAFDNIVQMFNQNK